jgi:hypothetical protein
VVRDDVDVNVDDRLWQRASLHSGGFVAHGL